MVSLFKAVSRRGQGCPFSTGPASPKTTDELAAGQGCLTRNAASLRLSFAPRTPSIRYRPVLGT